MLNEDGQDGLPVFFLVAFAASIGASIAVVATGGSGSPLVVGLGVLVMLAPASSALAAWKLSKRPFGNIGLKHFPVKYLVVALLLVPVATWIAGSVEFGIVGDGYPVGRVVGTRLLRDDPSGSSTWGRTVRSERVASEDRQEGALGPPCGQPPSVRRGGRMAGLHATPTDGKIRNVSRSHARGRYLGGVARAVWAKRHSIR